MRLEERWNKEKHSDWIVTPRKKRTNNFDILKMVEDQQIVFGWANVAIRKDGSTVEDLQGDIIDPAELEKSAYEYVLKFRDAGERHDPNKRKKGRLVESVVFTKEKMAAMGIPEGTVPEGWWVGFKVDDSDAWDKIKKGEYRSFSVEGTGERIPVDDGVQKSTERVAKTFREIYLSKTENNLDIIENREYNNSGEGNNGQIWKFNPYHDSKGRFTTGGGAMSFTWKPGKSKAHDNAIKREYAYQVVSNATEIRSNLSNEAKPLNPSPLDINKVMEEAGVDKATAEHAGRLAGEIFKKSSTEEPQITNDVISAASKNNGKMFGLDYRQKFETSMARKIASDARDDGVPLEVAAKGVKDSIRYTAVYETKDFASGYESVKSSLESKGYTLVRTKNYFADYENNPNSCIKSVQSVFKSPNGTMFEFQFQTPESQGAKEMTHPLYERQRAATTTAAEKARLNTTMREMFSSVPTSGEIQAIKTVKQK